MIGLEVLAMDGLFEVHRLNDQGMKNATAIAEAFDRLLRDLAGLCPAGREFSIVRTKLEEAAFFAKKAMATQAQNQQAA
jgi:hypothetical protein